MAKKIESIRKKQNKTIQDIFAQTAARYSEKNAVTDGEIRFTYNELFVQKERIRYYFRYSLRIGENQKIALFLPNCAEYIYVSLAAAEIGAIIIPLNIHWKERELRYYAEKCRITMVVTHSRFLPQWGGMPSQKKIAFVCIDQIRLPLHNTKTGISEKRRTFSATESPDTEVLYLCTSGSTGKPKVVPKTHALLTAGAKNLGKALAITSRDRFLGVTPFFHANGFENSMLLPIMKGASIVLMRQFSPRTMLKLLENEGITVVIGSPFIFGALCDTAEHPYDFPSIRLCLSAGAPLPGVLRQTFLAKFGIAIREHYGSSETGPLSAQMGDHQEDGSVGKPFDKVKVRITDENGEELSSGRTGQILIRSNSMIREYLDDPEMTRQAFTHGYFVTGDIGMVDRNGYIHILGKKKPTINAGGIKIDPVEIQNILLSFPQVKDALVTGIKNRRGSEIIKAIVVAQSHCTVNDIIIFCKEHLADYKIPRIIEFRDKIPTDMMGKTIRSHGEE